MNFGNFIIRLEILYLNNVSEYNELWERIKEEKPFWNLENIKKDINILISGLKPPEIREIRITNKFIGKAYKTPVTRPFRLNFTPEINAVRKDETNIKHNDI